MFADCIFELQGSVPNMDAAYAKTLLNEAWEDVRRIGGWSWQQAQTGFTVPGAIAGGAVSLQFGSATVTGDTVASAQWATASQYGSLVTQRQFRSGGVSGAGTIYDIVSADFTTPTAATLTLDRPYTDPLAGGVASATVQRYSIYQPYIVAPVKDFSRWLSVLDIANAGWIDTRGDRRMVDRVDPQRQQFGNPSMLLGIGQDARTGSSTAGWERYELWNGPYSQYLYQAWFMRFGSDLVNLTDTLPIGIPESMVKARARARAYEQAEANKDPRNERGMGADFRFLMGAATKQYEEELKWARLRDRDKVDIFNTTMTRFRGGPSVATFDPATGGIRDMVGV